MTKGSGTRSGLLWEVERLLNEVENLPQVLVMENVPQVHGKKNLEDFNKWLAFLESKGYTNFWQDLNSKNYGVAQNRNRCFCVSILGNYEYQFPKPIELEKVMKDYLEDDVEEKYYLTSEKAQKLVEKLLVGGKILEREVTCVDKSMQGLENGQVRIYQNNFPTISAIEYKEPRCVTEIKNVEQLGYIEKGTGQHQSNTVYSKNGLSPSLNARDYKDPVKVVKCQKLK